MTYQQTLELLFNMMPDFQRVGASAYKPGLERIEQFNRYLGSPDKSFMTIHIAGTNGKGSVSHMLASILNSAGYRVGLYTSPHLKDFRERIKVDAKMISEREVVVFAERHLGKMKELDLSFFEATVGMAFDHFSRSDVEVAVIETGLGGRLDATNIITPIVSVITNIGIDHTSFLGDSIESIAREKAGIIKPNVPVIVGERNSETSSIFKEVADGLESHIRFADKRFKLLEVTDSPSQDGIPRRDYHIKRYFCGHKAHFELDLLGDYQRHNILTVVATTELLNQKSRLSISRRAIRDGLRNAARDTGLKGRWQILGAEPLVVADTAHNAQGIGQVVEQLKRQQYEKLYIVFGVANDKDLDSILPLLPPTAHYIFTRASGERALASQTLAEQGERYDLEGEIIDSVGDAFKRAKELAGKGDMIYVGGSSFVVAELDL